MKKEDLKTELLNILFKHRANDRGNKELNLFDNRKELQEQDVYYAEMILSLLQKNTSRIMKKLELSKGLIEMRNEFTGEVNFINDANITELWTKLNETMEKINEMIDVISKLDESLDNSGFSFDHDGCLYVKIEHEK